MMMSARTAVSSEPQMRKSQVHAQVAVDGTQVLRAVGMRTSAPCSSTAACFTKASKGVCSQNGSHRHSGGLITEVSSYAVCLTYAAFSELEASH